jgi:hypothetical protein
MNRKTIVFIGSLILLAMLWSLLRAQWQLISSNVSAAPKPSPQASPSPPVLAVTPPPIPPTLQARRKETVDKILASLATPITFYGRIIDQNGDPVPNANVRYGVIDKFDADGSRYEDKSDASGYFSVDGIQGAVLTVGVWKNGYHIIENKSKGSFAYGVGADSTRKEPPTKNNPAIFVLQKGGITEPLIRLSTGGIKVPKNGSPVSIDLATGERTSASANCLKVEAWTEDKTSNAAGSYHWRCRVSVPGGGLVERKEQFDFEAPALGYQQYDEIVMLSNDPSWTRRFKKNYFAQFPSGNYARLQFQFTSGGDHFFIVESYLNPRPGSRNVEFDPQKVVKSP